MRKRIKGLLIFALMLLLTVTGVTLTSKEAKAAGSPSVSYQTHVQDYGWQNFVSNGATSGTQGESKRLEGINIVVDGGGADLGIRYTTHVQDYGWQLASENGATAGTQGESKRLEAIKIWLTGADAVNYDVQYRVHVQDYGWQNWVSNGNEAGTTGESKRLEGIEIVITPKSCTSKVAVQTHIQNIGWSGTCGEFDLSGSSGQSLRLEGITLQAVGIDGGIQYRTHVQDYGWLDYVSNGAISGTQGESKRLEAIQIQLTGNAANNFDIWYRVHAQNFGWLGWAANGGNAGTAGYSYRLEAIQVVVLPKGSGAPGDTTNSFVEARQIDLDTANFNGTNGTWNGAMAVEAFNLQNEERVKAGVQALEWNDTAYMIARLRAQELYIVCEQHGTINIDAYTAHHRPDGSDARTVAEAYGIEDALVNYSENGAMGAFYPNGIGLINGWVNSKGHYGCMIDGNWNSGAIACYYANGRYYCIGAFLR